MAKLFSKFGASAFGEAFVSSYELEKKINERRQELEQEYNFRRRQMSLDEAYRRKQVSLDESQEERLREQAIMNAIGSGFRPVQEGLVQGRLGRSGVYETHEPTREMFGETFAYPIQEQKLSEQKKFGEGIIGGGKYSTWGIPGEEEVTRYYLGEGETKKEKPEKPPEKIDLSNEVRDLEKYYQEYLNNRSSKDLAGKVKAYSEELISKADLQTERDIFWEEHKSGTSFDEIIKRINEYRTESGKQSLTDEQFDVLRRYYRTRTKAGYPEEKGFLGIF